MGLINYIGMAFSFGGNLVLARLLLPDMFGDVALASGLAAFVFMFAGFGSQEAIVQCRQDNLDHFISTAVWLSIAISFGLLIASALIAAVLTLFFDQTIVAVFLVVAVGRCVLNVADAYGAVLRRDFQFRQVSIIFVTSIFVSFLLAIIGAYAGLGVWALALRELIVALVLLVGYRAVSQYKLQRAFGKESAAWIWDFGWRVLVARINEVVFGRIDNVSIGSFIGSTALGYYSQAYRLATLGQQLTQLPLRFVSFSTYSEIQNRPDSLRYAFERVSFWLVRGALLLGLATVLFGQPITVLIYGPVWQTSGVILSHLFLFLSMTPLSENAKDILTATGHVSTVMIARVIQISIFVPLLTWSIWNQSLISVAWAVNISIVAATLTLYAAVHKHIQPKWLYLLQSPVIGVCCAALFHQLVLKQNFAVANSINLFIQATTTLLIYSTVLLLLERRAIFDEGQLIFKGLLINNANS